MKRFLFLLSFILCFNSITVINAQSEAQVIQNEIDKEVWTPFQKAFETLDAEVLNNIYAENVLRVTPGGIDTENAFKAGNISRFKTSKTNHVKIALDFWFDSRYTNASTSYEVGFYRITAIQDGKTNYNYGQFHIVLKKQNGLWKITQDWDTTTIHGDTIDATIFEKQKPRRF